MLHAMVSRVLDNCALKLIWLKCVCLTHPSSHSPLYETFALGCMSVNAKVNVRVMLGHLSEGLGALCSF